MKTPSMPTSSTRKEIMYSFTRSLMGRKLARMLIQVRSVVRTTRTRLMPSMPTVYSMPKAGIQGTLSTNVKPPMPGAAGSKDARSASERPKASSATPRAT